jgi:hypothetical protein
VKAAFLDGARVRAVEGSELARIVRYEREGFYIVRILATLRELVVHEDNLVLDFPILASARLPADDRAYQIDRARQFRANVASGVWPQDSCSSCKKEGFCCQKHGHHHLDMCVHCGNDERDPRRWLYRQDATRKA